MSTTRVAIVTGAATGLGATIAVRLAAEGIAVVVNHLPEQAEAAAEVVARAGDNAIAVPADIADTGQLENLFKAATERFGGVDILVNNAVLPVLKPMAEVTEEEFDRSFAVNARAPFFAMRLAAEHMRDGGRVINISSHTTGLFFPRYGLYDGAKGALEQFSRVFSKEIGARGITVNVVSPRPSGSAVHRFELPRRALGADSAGRRSTSARTVLRLCGGAAGDAGDDQPGNAREHRNRNACAHRNPPLMSDRR